MKALAAAAAAAALWSAGHAQTHTACNPLNTTGCPAVPALGGVAAFDFSLRDIDIRGKIWTQRNDGVVDASKDGATFTVSRSGDAPMVQSVFYLFFGRFECVMKAASGQGIVSSVILQSEDLDEVDWEFLGSNHTHVMTNYFGKGNTTSYDRGRNYPVNFVPQDGFHNYTVDWTKERIQWWVDGSLVRELPFAAALGGRNYPQTPMNIRMGVWAAGDSSNNDPGVIQWAGGETNFKEAPFTMIVKSVYAKDYSSAAEYSWDNMDASGSWQKVKLVPGHSAVLQEIQKPTGVRNHWAALSRPAKVAILGSVVGVSLAIFAFLTICCIKQRRAGRREHAAEMARYQQEAAELQEYKKQMRAGQFGFGNVNQTVSRAGAGTHRYATNRF